jgi:hypothetical protein
MLITKEKAGYRLRGFLCFVCYFEVVRHFLNIRTQIKSNRFLKRVDFVTEPKKVTIDLASKRHIIKSKLSNYRCETSRQEAEYMDIFERLRAGEAIDMMSEEYRPAIAELNRANLTLNRVNHTEPNPKN